MVMRMEEIREKLRNIKEPKNLKDYFRRMLDENEKIAAATIKQGWWLAEIVYDNNKDAWKELGIRWPDLIKAASIIYLHSIAWIKGEITWQELMDKLLETVIVIKKIGGTHGK